MRMPVTLTLTANQQLELKHHLFPSDGNEAVALALCGRHRGKDRARLLVHKIIPIPYEQCTNRTRGSVSWSPLFVEQHLDRASAKGLAVVKIHSHPGGQEFFSVADEQSDERLFSSLRGWFEEDDPHASVIMLPDGKMFGRAFSGGLDPTPIARISVIGDDILIWDHETGMSETAPPEFATRNIQAFGKGTFSRLRSLTVGVVGYSGTGSPVVEQLLRLGVGKLVMVEYETVEEKNLNRILNSTMEDARNKRPKTQVLSRVVENLEFGTQLEIIAAPVNDKRAIEAIAQCDFVFGCMDSIDGRHILNRIATFYLIPYIDVGVRLEADGQGGVAQICGSIHYLQPGLSTLLSRELYTEENLRAAFMKRHDPAHYHEMVASKYISGIQEDRPAVISVNMQFAAMAVNDFLARIHRYRHESNEGYSVDTFSLSNGEHFRKGEKDITPYPPWVKYVGRGDCRPTIDMPEYGENPK